MTHRREMMKDGLMLAKPEDFHVFPSQVIAVGSYSLGVSIPIDIARYLKIEKGTVILCAIQKTTKERAVKQFGHYSRRVRNPTYVDCPVCHRRGTLNRGTYGYLRVNHFKMHGFTKRTSHSIAKGKFPLFYKKYENWRVKKKGEP